MDASQKVEEYISKNSRWEEALHLLRTIIHKSGLKEAVKWGMPVYTFKDKNVIGIGAFKSYVGLWFYQGALLKDPHNLLVNASEGKTKAMRQIRYQSFEEIDRVVLEQYIYEAIENQKKGNEIKPDLNKPLEIPEELKEAFKSNPKLSESFEKFSLSKKREFTDYISEAKRVETKLKRIEKITSLILEGTGLHDRYR